MPGNRLIGFLTHCSESNGFEALRRLSTFLRRPTTWMKVWQVIGIVFPGGSPGNFMTRGSYAREEREVILSLCPYSGHCVILYLCSLFQIDECITLVLPKQGLTVGSQHILWLSQTALCSMHILMSSSWHVLISLLQNTFNNGTVNPVYVTLGILHLELIISHLPQLNSTNLMHLKISIKQTRNR